MGPQTAFWCLLKYMKEYTSKDKTYRFYLRGEIIFQFVLTWCPNRGEKLC